MERIYREFGLVRVYGPEKHPFNSSIIIPPRITWGWRTDVDDSIAEAEQFIKDLQAAVEFAKTLTE